MSCFSRDIDPLQPATEKSHTLQNSADRSLVCLPCDISDPITKSLGQQLELGKGCIDVTLRQSQTHRHARRERPGDRVLFRQVPKSFHG